MKKNTVNSETKQTKPKKVKLTKFAKILIGVAGGTLGVLVIIGLIFLIIYGATLGTVTLNGFCMANASCITNSSMICVSSSCTCISPLTWNSSNSKCVSNGTNSTNTTITIPSTTVTLASYQKAIKLVSSLNFTNITVTTFSGGTYTNTYDVRTYTNYLNTMYIYVCDHIQGVLAMYYENGTFYKQISPSGAMYIEIMPNGNVYVTRYTSARVDLYDQDLNFITFYSNTNFVTIAYGIRYFPTTGYIYECDLGTGWINAFDFSLTRVATESLSFSGYTPFCINYYNSTLFIGTTSNVILVVQNKAIVRTISSVCITNYVTDIDIDQTTGYMFLSCFWDKRIQVWYTNDTQSTRTGYMMVFSYNPLASTVDKYGRLIVTHHNPGGFDIFTLNQ